MIWEGLKTQDLHTKNTRDKEYIELDIESENIELQYWLLQKTHNTEMNIGIQIYYRENRI